MQDYNAGWYCDTKGMEAMKRMLALILALVLLVGYLPVTHAHATEAEEIPPVVEEHLPEEETEPETEETTEPITEETASEETEATMEPAAEETSVTEEPSAPETEVPVPETSNPETEVTEFDAAPLELEELVVTDEASAATVTGTSGSYKYEIVDNQYVVITQYTGSSATVSIPKTIKNLPVKEIGNHAFIGGIDFADDIIILENTKLVEVTIPKGVVKIGSEAFSNCINLKKVSMPDSVTEIGSHAFRDCRGTRSR